MFVFNWKISSSNLFLESTFDAQFRVLVCNDRLITSEGRFLWIYKVYISARPHILRALCLKNYEIGYVMQEQCIGYVIKTERCFAIQVCFGLIGFRTLFMCMYVFYLFLSIFRLSCKYFIIYRILLLFAYSWYTC